MKWLYHWIWPDGFLGEVNDTTYAFVIFFATVLVILMWTVVLALAHDYKHPDQDEWYGSLKQPDQPTMSCCGVVDAYWADSVDECGPGDIPQGEVPERNTCAMVAIITDTREIRHRYQHPVGTRIPIPRHKIRKHASANPTSHNIVFVSSARFVYCWEPLPLI